VLRPPIESAQYTSIRFTETLALEGLSASIGSVGDAYDNAVAESVFGLFKNEALAAGSPFRTGPLRTLADIEKVTTDYLDWFGYAGNTRRVSRDLTWWRGCLFPEVVRVHAVPGSCFA
jgi:putative transposase